MKAFEPLPIGKKVTEWRVIYGTDVKYSNFDGMYGQSSALRVFRKIKPDLVHPENLRLERVTKEELIVPT